EEQVLEAINTGHKAIKTICEALSKWQEHIGKPKNRTTLWQLPKEVYDAVDAIVKPSIGPALRIKEKQKREEAQTSLRQEVLKALLPEGKEPLHDPQDVERALKKASSKYMRKMILEENLRSDGRGSTDIRVIDIEQSLLPRVHGSTLFTRGET